MKKRFIICQVPNVKWVIIVYEKTKRLINELNKYLARALRRRRSDEFNEVEELNELYNRLQIFEQKLNELYYNKDSSKTKKQEPEKGP